LSISKLKGHPDAHAGSDFHPSCGWVSSGAAEQVSTQYTVARALANYVEDYRRRGGKSAEGIESIVRRNVLPELGAMPVRKPTTRRLLDWHRDMAARPRYWRSRPGAKPNTASFNALVTAASLSLQ
jgi:hypothetical protein